MKKFLLTVIFGVAISGFLFAQDEQDTTTITTDDQIAEVKGSVEGMNETLLEMKSVLDALKKIKISGYIRAQFQSAETDGANSVYQRGANLRNKTFIFQDREDAGRRLSEFLLDYKGTDSIVLAIPAGGVAVGKEIKNALFLPLDLLIVRKIKIPWNPEAGFGAINLDGYVVFNEDLLNHLNLPERVIASQVAKTRETLKKRNLLFRVGREFPSLKNKTIILADDGLASGYTMIAAIEYAKRRNPSKIVVAVPTGSYKTVKKISSFVDVLCCLNIRESYLMRLPRHTGTGMT